MGWWSTDIIGGDLPLDFEDEFYAELGVEKYPENSNEKTELTKEQLQDNQDKLVDLIKASKHFFEKDEPVGYQVLAVLMMEKGAEIKPKNLALMLKACDDDDWAKHNEERAESISGLRNALLEYDNLNPIIIKSKGLFEIIFKHLNDE